MSSKLLNWPDSLWISTAEPADDLGTVAESIETDLLIIGAGYTGLSTALHARPDFSEIVVIDQAQPGWGCSGRNGGQINPQWKSPIHHLRQQYPGSEFDLFIQLLASSTDAVFKLIDKYSIQCLLQRSGALIPAKGRAATSYLKEWTKFWLAYGANVQLLDSTQTANAIGTMAYDAAMSMADGGSLHPLSYTRGLVRACLTENIRVYGDSPATRITAKRQGWAVHIGRETISCKNLVIATNGYTDGLWPGLSQSFVPVASMISATEPLPSAAAHSILPGRQSVAEYAGLPYYYRLDESNRLIMGGRGTRTGGTGSLDTTHLRQAAVKLFPLLKQTQWEFDWAGYVGVTHHQRPMLVQLGENAYAGLGYNGRGITMATAMGNQISRALSGKRTLLPIEPLKRTPMHRMYRTGVACRILYGEFKDRQSGLR